MKNFSYVLAGLDFILVPLNIYLGITYGHPISWIAATASFVCGICVLVINH